MVELGLMAEKNTKSDGSITSIVQIEEIEKITPFWELIYTLKKVTRD